MSGTATSSSSSSTSARARRAAAPAGHKHITSLVDSFELPAEYGVVLELVSGGEVFDRICDLGTYSAREAAGVEGGVAPEGA